MSGQSVDGLSDLMPPKSATAESLWDDAGVDALLARLPLRAKPLISTLYGDSILPLGGGAWLSSVIALMEPMGLSERVVRTAVFRLRRDGWLNAERRGRRSFYTLTAEAQRHFRAAEARIYAGPQDTWDGIWSIAVLTGAGDDEKRGALHRRLIDSGYGALGAGTYAMPLRDADPLPGLLRETGMQQHVLGLRAEAQDGALPDSIGALVAQVWPLDDLATRYGDFVDTFMPIHETIAGAVAAGEADDPCTCFVLRTLLIDAYRRILLKDPGLPRAVLPADWPGLAAAQLTGKLYRLIAVPAQDYVKDVLSADGLRSRALRSDFHRRFAA